MTHRDIAATRLIAVAAFLLALSALACAVAPEAAARRGIEGPAGPPAQTFAAAYARALLRPGIMPPDVNDWNCRPSPTHPRPVVLVHGTWDNSYATWSMFSPMLKQAGYCAYALNYGQDPSSLIGIAPGVYGTQALLKSGDEVASFVDEVRSRTGARQVDLVGHSQGAIHTRLYLQDHGGWNPLDPAQSPVRKIVGLGPNNHGTVFFGLAAMGGSIQDYGLPIMDVSRLPLGDAGIDQGIGSPFFRHLNAQGDTRPGIAYTMIATRYDEIVSPYRGQFLANEPGSDVTNITLQDGCPADRSEHLAMTFSPRALDMVLAALDDGNYRATHPEVCTPVLPALGTPAGVGAALSSGGSL